jgi:hypothetical protein
MEQLVVEQGDRAVESVSTFAALINVKELDDWIMQDQRRTAVICRAKYEGQMKYCCILHDPVRWQISEKDFPGESRRNHVGQKIVYADTLAEAVLGAIAQ